MNNRIIIPVNRRFTNYTKFISTFKPVIEHWKVPYRIIDTKHDAFEKNILDCGLILLIQPGIGKALNKSVISVMEVALKSGSGLFIADYSFLENKHLSRFSFSSNFPVVSREAKVSQLQVHDNEHFISSTKDKDEIIRLPVNLKVLLVKGNNKSYNTIVKFRGKKILFFLNKKDINIGFFLISPASILGKLGFGTDLDVFYWKSIIYLARKPFVQLLPPHFLTFRIEDSIGEGNYKYLDFVLKQGFKTHLGLDLTDFDRSLSKKLLQYQHKGLIECSPHSFSHFKKAPLEETHLIFINFNGKEYSQKIIRENFVRLAAFKKETGIRYSAVLTYHYCQLGKNALSYLKDMGVKYLGFPFRTNVKLDDALKKQWRLYPFGKLGLVADYLPEDKSFFVINSLSFPVQKLSRRQSMNVAITSDLDFLYGLRLKAPGKKFEQYKEASERVYKHVRWSVENMFFSTVFTHETLINYLRIEEFKRLIRVIVDKLKPFEVKNELYADIAKYYQERFHTRLTSCIVKGKDIFCDVTSEAASYSYVTVYSEQNRKIKRKSERIKTNGQRETILIKL